ncbi:MAG: phosphoribosylaminoimidazolesuccinocarboxamide synthase [Alphaproteobacteria bacterium]|nr:phosphoribosylaminoimidazolesuccinocarboxamide synthase [Alphaproteobacteria bacterium]MBU0859996.1 phosphoribosylaminoimidazolesuccinocarboxamide synthase [Alphaproteobacteria bacterium]
MAGRKLMYEGKAKTIYEGPEPGTLIQYFKDDATAGNGAKKAVIAGKGVLNNRISAHLMNKLESIGIPTHFMRLMNMREQLVKQVEIIPIEVVIRNIAAGSLCTRLGIKEGTILPQPVVEFYYKKDELNDPMVNEHHIVSFHWADPYELEEMVHMTYRVNDYLNGLFAGIGLRLVDFKLEFGRLFGEYGEVYLLLADEISPDNCRLWDAATGEKLDKDRFRQDLGDVIEGYQQVAERLGLVPKGGIINGGNINEQLAASLGEIENELAKQRRLRDVKPQKPRKV